MTQQFKSCLLILFLFLASIARLSAQCPLSPPSSLTITNITTTSVTAQWPAVPGAALYRVRLHDDTWNMTLPDEFTTLTTHTRNDLVSGHDYTLSVAASACADPDQPFGNGISANLQAEVIIVDIIIEMPACNPSAITFASQHTLVLPSPDAVNPIRKVKIHQTVDQQEVNVVEFALWANCEHAVEFYQMAASRGIVRNPSGSGECTMVQYFADQTLYFALKNPAWDAFDGTTQIDLVFGPTINSANIGICNNADSKDCNPASRPGKTTATGSTLQLQAAVLDLALSPNPVRDVCQIDYSLPEEGPVELLLLDLNGRILRTVDIAGALPAGTHRTVLRTDDLQAGAYFIALQTKHQRRTSLFVKQ